MKGETQFSLPFRKDAAAEDQWAELLELVRLAVEAMGGVKELAYQVDSSPSMVSDALREQDRKRVAAEWLVPIILRAPIETVQPIIAKLAELRGFDVKRRKVLTTEEKLERALDKLRTYGKSGREEAEEIDRG